MEKLVHKADGRLVADDPFQIVGTEGYLAGSSENKWIITEESLRKLKAEQLVDTTTGAMPYWIKGPGIPTNGMFAGPYNKKALVITKEGE